MRWLADWVRYLYEVALLIITGTIDHYRSRRRGER